MNSLCFSLSIKGLVFLPVNEQILGQPFCANDFENDLIGLQSLEVYTAGQGRV